MQKKNKTLAEWIDEKGAGNVAELLNVATSTVRHWRTGHALPKASQMQAIKKASKGVVSYEGIIEKRPVT